MAVVVGWPASPGRRTELGIHSHVECRAQHGAPLRASGSEHRAGGTPRVARSVEAAWHGHKFGLYCTRYRTLHAHVEVPRPCDHATPRFGQGKALRSWRVLGVAHPGAASAAGRPASLSRSLADRSDANLPMLSAVQQHSVRPRILAGVRMREISLAQTNRFAHDLTVTAEHGRVERELGRAHHDKGVPEWRQTHRCVHDPRYTVWFANSGEVAVSHDEPLLCVLALPLGGLFSERQLLRRHWDGERPPPSARIGVLPDGVPSSQGGCALPASGPLR
jgi:hypothetical protein